MRLLRDPFLIVICCLVALLWAGPALAQSVQDVQVGTQTNGATGLGFSANSATNPVFTSPATSANTQPVNVSQVGGQTAVVTVNGALNTLTCDKTTSGQCQSVDASGRASTNTGAVGGNALGAKTILQNAATSNGNGTVMQVGGLSQLGLQITGTYNGATINFEGSIDDSNFVSVFCYNVTAGTPAPTVSTASLLGIETCNVAGLDQFRARISGAGGSTNLTVTAIPTTAPLQRSLTIDNGGGVAFSLPRLNTDTISTGAGAILTAGPPVLFDGNATWSYQRNNTAVTLLASAAQTTTQTSADQTNFNSRGIHIIVDVTNAGTGSITMTLNGKDPASSKYYLLLSGNAITSNSTNIYRLYPGITTSANANASDILPRTFQIVITANNSNSMTYSVGYNLDN